MIPKGSTNIDVCMYDIYIYMCVCVCVCAADQMHSVGLCLPRASRPS